MLKELHLTNFALARQLQLPLAKGFSVITGETGAGKSILLHALSACLGDRADSSAVRVGCDKADLTATFDICSLPLVQDWLKQRDMLAEENEVLLRRVISCEGRSKAWINGIPTNIADLKQLSDMLVQVHSQHSQQNLFSASYAREWLDSVLGLQELASAVKTNYQQWQSLDKQCTQLTLSSQAAIDKKHLLEGYISEFEPLAELNYSQLEAEYDTLSQHDHLMQTAQQLRQGFEAEEHNILSFLSSLLKLSQSASYSMFDTVQTHLFAAEAELDEARKLVSHFVDSTEFDPARYAQLNEQLAEFHKLARKHKTEPNELANMYSNWNTQLGNFLNASTLENLQLETEKAFAAYQQLDSELQTKRKKGIPQVLEQLCSMVKTLALPEASFDFSIQSQPHSGAGSCDYQLQFTANKGMPLQLLSKTVSGGELSRIALVLQLMRANEVSASTLVFDEVDVGISGGTAEVVGRLLRKLGKSLQVLCITHQPQVAALGNTHLLVQKIQEDPAASTITTLDHEQRVHEIARISGGLEISEAVLTHARHMLLQADS